MWKYVQLLITLGLLGYSVDRSPVFTFYCDSAAPIYRVVATPYAGDLRWCFDNLSDVDIIALGLLNPVEQQGVRGFFNGIESFCVYGQNLAWERDLAQKTGCAW